MINTTIHTALGNIEYSSIGKGQPILFVHGGHANSKETLPYKGLDTTHFQLITPSRKGYGATPLGKKATPLDTAHLFMTLLDQLKIDKVIVYGISAGGYTAIELAAHYPNRVEKLILAAAVTQKWLDKKGSTYKIAQKIFHPKIERFTWGMVSFFSRLFPTLIAKSFFKEFSTNPTAQPTKKESQVLANILQKYHSKQGFLNDIDQNIEANSLKKIKCPTLILHSEYDNSVPLSHPKQAHSLIPSSELHLFKNKWGHLLWLGEDYDKILPIILHFLKDSK